MAVSQMKKLTLLIPKKEVNRMLKKLMWTGSVEVTEIEGETLPSALSDYAAELTDYTRKLGQIEEAMRLLKDYAAPSGGMFFKPKRYAPSVYDNADEGLEKGLEMASAVFGATNALAEAQTKIALVKGKIES